MTINDNEKKILEHLVNNIDEDHATYFRFIAADTKIEIKVVRPACRSLARKGLTEFMRGLFDEDGLTAGSGYAATREGRDLVMEWEQEAEIAKSHKESQLI